MRNEQKVRAVAEKLLPAIAYGDAAGLPFETKSAEDIRAKMHGVYVTSLQPTEHNDYFPGLHEVGTTSDDTQLSRAVARSLVQARGFSLESQARELVYEYHHNPTVMISGHEYPRGWGGSTTAAARAIEQGMDPSMSGHEKGTGNGVIMKMAPLAMYQALQAVSPATRCAQYDQLTTMTHDTHIAREMTRLHGEVLHGLLGGVSVREVVRQHVLLFESGFSDEARMLELSVESPCEDFDSLVARYATGKPGKKYGFYVPETLAMSYDIFAAAEGNYTDAVWLAANLGGDCDSTASIVGAMCIAHNPDQVFPQDIDKVEDIATIREESRKLAVL